MQELYKSSADCAKSGKQDVKAAESSVLIGGGSIRFIENKFSKQQKNVSLIFVPIRKMPLVSW